MTDRTVHLPVAAQSSLESLVHLGESVEAHGYDRAWLPETWGRDAITVLATLAARTDEVGIGTSIINAYSRTPATMAQSAATLQEASDGRFRLGIGPSGPAVILGWHGHEFEQPLRRTREYVEIIRMALAGETVRYAGDIFQLGGFRLRQGPPDEPVGIDVTGMGPKAVELAGRFADGWHALMFSPSGFEDRLADLERGADLGDRTVDDVRVTLTVPCCALEDADRARALVRQHLAFYVGGMGTFYRDALARQGYDTLAHTVYDAWQSDERDTALEAIEPLVDELGAVGTPDEARAQFEEFAALDGADSIAVSFPRGADHDEIESTMAALAPD
jgi:coenzyme F420-dependent oxidoreductase